MKVLVRIFSPFTIVGCVLLFFGWHFFVETRAFIAGAARGEGQVVENHWKMGRRTGAFFPRVRFRSAAGQEFTFLSDTGSKPPSYKVGDHVSVFYNPDNPVKSAQIDSFVSQWLLPLGLGGLGVIFASVSLGPLVWSLFVRPSENL